MALGQRDDVATGERASLELGVPARSPEAASTFGKREGRRQASVVRGFTALLFLALQEEVVQSGPYPRPSHC